MGNVSLQQKLEVEGSCFDLEVLIVTALRREFLSATKMKGGEMKDRQCSSSFAGARRNVLVSVWFLDDHGIFIHWTVGPTSEP